MLKKARNIALKILENLEWKNKYFRKDIGHLVIDKWELFLENIEVKN